MYTLQQHNERYKIKKTQVSLEKTSQPQAEKIQRTDCQTG